MSVIQRDVISIKAHAFTSSAPLVAMPYETLLIEGLGLLTLLCVVGYLFHCQQAGVALLIIAALAVPTGIESGAAYGIGPSLVLAPVIIGTTFLGAHGLPWRKWLARQKVLIPLIAFLSATLLSLLLGWFTALPVRSAPLQAQLGQLAIILFSGGVFIASAWLLKDLRWLRWVTWTFILLGALRMLLLLASATGYVPSVLMPGGTLGSMFWTWLTTLAASQAVLNRDLSATSRLALAALAGSAVYITVFTWRDWASGWLPTIVGMIAMAAVGKPRIALCLAPVAGGLCIWEYSSLRAALWTADQQYSFLTRVDAARVLWELFPTNPMFGLGPANYYHYTVLHPLLGWYVRFSSHNNYLDVLLQTGLVGFSAFLCFLAMLCKVALRLRSVAVDGFPRAFAYGAIGGLAGTLCAGALGDWFLPFAYNIGLRGFPVSVLAWVFLGGLVALDDVFVERRESEVSERNGK